MAGGESPGGVILYLLDGPYTAFLFRNVPVAMTEAAQLRTDGISKCCYLVNIHITQPSVKSKKGMTWYSSRPLPSLWFGLYVPLIPYFPHPSALFCSQGERGGGRGWLTQRHDANRGE